MPGEPSSWSELIGNLGLPIVLLLGFIFMAIGIIRKAYPLVVRLVDGHLDLMKSHTEQNQKQTAILQEFGREQKTQGQVLREIRDGHQRRA